MSYHAKRRTSKRKKVKRKKYVPGPPAPPKYDRVDPQRRPASKSKNYIHQDDFAYAKSCVKHLNINFPHTDLIMLFDMMYWCGLRVSEALGVCERDMDLNEGVLWLGRTKTERGATQLIPPECVGIMREWISTRRERHIADDAPVIGASVRSIQRWVRWLGELTGIPVLLATQYETGEKVLTHCFRKTIGKDMLRGTHRPKVDIGVAGKHLRHSNPKTTATYIKADKEANREHWYGQSKTPPPGDVPPDEPVEYIEIDEDDDWDAGTESSPDGMDKGG